jgi:hypothetical protein
LLDRLSYDRRGQAAGLMGTILVGFIVALVAMNLTGTMSGVAENSARLYENVDGHASVLPSQTGAPPLIRLSGGLLWAIAIVAVVIGIALGALKHSGVM